VKGVDVSALRKESGLEDQGRDVKAVISSDLLKADDFRAGLFREAEITETVVDWRHPWAGSLQTEVLWIQTCKWDGDLLAAEVTGPESFLKNEAGQVYGMECRWDVGDAFGQSYAGCKVNLDNYTLFGLAIGINLGYVIEPRRSFHITYSTVGQPWDVDDFFTLGKVEFLSGANVGLTMDIRNHTRIDANDFEIELMFEMPYDMDRADYINLRPGCNKISGIFSPFGDCKNKFDALQYFGGFPYIPGTDKMLERPLTSTETEGR